MRLLLDESVPVRLRHYMLGHEVLTAVEMGWSGVKNGRLLELAATNNFEAFITVDKNLPYQQNLAKLPIAVFVLDALSNEIHALQPLLSKLEIEMASLKPNTLVLIRAGA